MFVVVHVPFGFNLCLTKACHYCTSVALGAASFEDYTENIKPLTSQGKFATQFRTLTLGKLIKAKADFRYASKSKCGHAAKMLKGHAETFSNEHHTTILSGTDADKLLEAAGSMQTSASTCLALIPNGEREQFCELSDNKGNLETIAAKKMHAVARISVLNFKVFDTQMWLAVRDIYNRVGEVVANDQLLADMRSLPQRAKAVLDKLVTTEKIRHLLSEDEMKLWTQTHRYYTLLANDIAVLFAFVFWGKIPNELGVEQVDAVSVLLKTVTADPKALYPRLKACEGCDPATDIEADGGPAISSWWPSVVNKTKVSLTSFLAKHRSNIVDKRSYKTAQDVWGNISKAKTDEQVAPNFAALLKPVKNALLAGSAAERKDVQSKILAIAQIASALQSLGATVEGDQKVGKLHLHELKVAMVAFDAATVVCQLEDRSKEKGKKIVKAFADAELWKSIDAECAQWLSKVKGAKAALLRAINEADGFSNNGMDEKKKVALVLPDDGKDLLTTFVQNVAAENLDTVFREGCVALANGGYQSLKELAEQDYVTIERLHSKVLEATKEENDAANACWTQQKKLLPKVKAVCATVSVPFKDVWHNQSHRNGDCYLNTLGFVYLNAAIQVPAIGSRYSHTSGV